MDIVCDGSNITVNRSNVLVPCESIACNNCIFSATTGFCFEARKNWCNSEYREPEIDWNKVPVDTPVLVSHESKCPYCHRHFAKYENGYVYAFLNGATSWTTENSISWEYVKLANEEDIKKYVKYE